MNSKLIIARGTRSIGTCAYEGVSEITELRVPEGVRRIGCGAFLRCAALCEASLPRSLCEIGEMAFALTSLESVSVPDGVELVGVRAFAFNTRLRSVHIGRNVKRIMHGAFLGCQSLENITVDSENDNYYVQNGCLIEKNTQKLIAATAPYVIADGVKIIGKQAIAFVLNCDTVTIPASVEYIDMEGDPIKNFDMARRLEYDEGGDVLVNAPLTVIAPRSSYAIDFAKKQNFKYKEI